MEFFKRYISNTVAGSGSQFFFYNENEGETRSCTLYRVNRGGEYSYSFLISNTLDSTFSDGSESHKNLVIDEWTIEKMLVGVCPVCDQNSFEYPLEMKQVLFDGQSKKRVNPAELFCTDPVKLDAGEGEYICVEIVFSGHMIPKHEESIVPSFVYRNGEWVASKNHPFVSMVGIEAGAKQRIAFLGDSITQGCGTPINAYEHWCAVYAGLLGNEYAYWNLGLGYGRADDAASDGIWLYKAKQNDIVFVCYGVNDIIQGYDVDLTKKNLQTIVDKLRLAGARVFIQTIPPFDYSCDKRGKWQELNDFIKSELKGAEYIFDCVKCLSKSESETHMSKYAPHPNSEGCRVWAEALYEATKDLIDK